MFGNLEVLSLDLRLGREDQLETNLQSRIGRIIPGMVGLLGVVLAGSLLQSDAKKDLEFLRTLTLDILQQSRVAPGSTGPADWKIKNSVGFSLVTPGRRGYPAFWIRDFSMACDSGLVQTKELQNHLTLVAKCQSDVIIRRLGSGGILPALSIPDHINFDGRPVYYPGTYSSGEDQGGEPWGIYPPADDHFEFVHLGWLLTQQTKTSEVLRHKVGDFTILERMECAFFSPMDEHIDGLYETLPGTRAVGFGFCDSVTFTGKVLYPSLLRWRAAKELYQLTRKEMYRKTMSAIAKNIPLVFGEQSGWLRAATGVGKQPDVWGTLLALNLGLLDKGSAAKAQKAVVKAYKAGTISLEGAVRHVPTDRDFSATSAWEKALPGKGVYQNGAYWHTPTGFLIETLMKEDKVLGRKVFADYVKHLRKGGEIPWECFNPALGHTQNGGYLASVAWPYSVLKGLF